MMSAKCISLLFALLLLLAVGVTNVRSVKLADEPRFINKKKLQLVSGKGETDSGRKISFYSKKKGDKEYMGFSFKSLDDLDDDDLAKFQVKAKRDGVIRLILITKGGEKTIIKMSSEIHGGVMTDDEVEDLTSLATSALGSAYVSTTFALARDGYIGADNSALLAFYRWAQYLDTVATESGKERRELHAMERESMLNERSSMVTEVNPNEYDFEAGQHRQLLCRQNKCGNACYGMCGPGCTCWKWKCGHCGCEPECEEHDYYCSCKSMFHFWCVNVFWVNCS